MKKIALFVLLFAGITIASAQKSREIERTFKVTPTQRIEINGFSGSEISFKSWEKPEVYLKIRVQVSSSNSDYEDEYIESVKLVDSQSASALTISFEDQKKGRSFFGFGYIRKEISGEIYVPQSNPLSANIPYASVSLENMKGEIRLNGKSNTLSLRNCTSVREIVNDYGKTTIENSGGDLKFEGKSGAIIIENFKGSVNVDADYSTITMTQIDKPTTVRSKSAKLRLEEIRGDLTVDSDYSTITINNVSGFVYARTKSGTVRVKQVDGINVDADYSTVDITNVTGKSGKEIVIKGRSGNLTLHDAVSAVRIDNPYSNMSLRRIKGAVSLTSTSSRVRAEDITGDWNSNTQYVTLSILGLVAQNVVITNKSNPVDVELKNAPSKVDIKNEYGGVSVTMRPGFSGEVSLEATYGKIDCDLPIKVKNLGGGAYGIGKIGNGSGQITIETKSANIRLYEKGGV